MSASAIFEASWGDGSYVCGSVSAGIKIVRLIFSPPISLTKSPSIGVVAKTFILSEVASSVVPVPQAIKTIDSTIAPIL